MDWPQVIVGALAAAGLVAIGGWIRKAVGKITSDDIGPLRQMEFEFKETADDIIDRQANEKHAAIDRAISSSRPSTEIANMMNDVFTNFDESKKSQ